MSEYSKFRNLDSFQCNVCRYLDRFKCACLEKPYCELEIERAYQQGRADAIEEFVKVIDSRIDTLIEKEWLHSVAKQLKRTE